MPRILTSSHYDLLSDEAQARSDLDALVETAEMKVIDRYREVRPDDQVEDYFGGTITGEAIQLDGWQEDDQGNPDTEAMNSDLVRRLRLTIARVVDHEAESPDGNVSSMSQGDKSVNYSEDAGEMDSSVFSLLRRYDQRDVWH